MSPRHEDRAAAFLSGGGELAERIRAFDWTATPLARPAEWPHALLIAVRIMLTSRQPIWIGWGEELTYLYNDPYKSIIGGKHPDALGLPTRVVWREIWDVISPMLQTALTGDEGTYVESQRLIMERHGYREETYYTFSYSPIPSDDGGVGGIICANTDDTAGVIGARQLALLRDVAAETADARTWQEACGRGAAALGLNRYDLPFAAIYVEERDGLFLAGTSGIEAGHAAAPTEAAPGGAWPVADVLRGRDVRVVDVPTALARTLPTGAWDEPPAHVALVPLGGGGQTGRSGVLVAGLNPFRLFDRRYEDFLGLLGGQIAASIARAEAFEEERKRAEALAELDRAKTVFFSNVSHEFRTPLTLMLGPLDELLAAAAVRPSDRAVLEVVHRNALRLLRMVNTVLDFSRVDSGQTLGEFRPTDLARLTTDVAQRFAPLMKRGGLSFAIEVEALPEQAYVDADAWERIVLNLLSNAFKFTLAGGIALALRAVGGDAVLTVSDTGTGVPADELPHLFERFHRVRNEHARTQEGTGIGLALVRELVELHGGGIGVESEEGVGTTFTVRIPFGINHLPAERVHDDDGAGASPALAVAFVEEASRWIGVDDDGADVVTTVPGDDDGDRGEDRIVVVDDNADMRDYLVRLLARRWRVDAHPDGQAALDAIEADPPALVLTDVMMPRLDGFGLLAALRASSRTATIPVIVVSARAGEESSVEGLEAGADDYLVKPFSPVELLARVRVNLELARLRAEAGRLSALEEVRSRVITTVSHELRTPVSAIFGAAKTLDRADLDERTVRELLSVISSEASRLARITNDILTTEMLASGIVSLAPEPVDVRAVVSAAVTAAQARRAESVRVHASLPPEPTTVHADASRLQQVLTNLLDNAIKYSPDGGAVAVTVADGSGTVDVVVADEGIGVPPEARDEIFQRFFRVDPELTGGVGGTGLGLYISRQIVEAMGGTIRYEPNEPCGSRFVVSLPRAK